MRQSHAHAWAEYWQAGRGWVRVDPTAAVAPDRIDAQPAASAPQPGLVAGALGSVSPELLAQLRAGWEALNNRWNQWVLNYSRGQQFDLLQSLGFAIADWADLALLLLGAAGRRRAGRRGLGLWDRHRQDPWQRLQAQVRDALAPLGVQARPHDPPRPLAALVRDRARRPQRPARLRARRARPLTLRPQGPAQARSGLVAPLLRSTTVRLRRAV